MHVKKNILSTDCVNARAGYTSKKHFWPLDNPVTSLSTCHLGVLPWVTILLNLDLNTLLQFTVPITFGASRKLPMRRQAYSINKVGTFKHHTRVQYVYNYSSSLCLEVFVLRDVLSANLIKS